jgi:hypothetical protein
MFKTAVDDRLNYLGFEQHVFEAGGVDTCVSGGLSGAGSVSVLNLVVVTEFVVVEVGQIYCLFVNHLECLFENLVNVMFWAGTKRL